MPRCMSTPPPGVSSFVPAAASDFSESGLASIVSTFPVWEIRDTRRLFRYPPRAKLLELGCLPVVILDGCEAPELRAPRLGELPRAGSRTARCGERGFTDLVDLFLADYIRLAGDRPTEEVEEVDLRRAGVDHHRVFVRSRDRL